MELLTKKRRNRKPHSEETKMKMRASMLRNGHQPPSQKGVIRSRETCRKIGEAKIGHTHTDEMRKKMSENRTGSGNHFFGRTHKKSTLEKMSLAKIGKRPPNYIEDRIVANDKRTLKRTPEWKKWREYVFKRDNYACQECKKRGIYIEAHHIIPMRISMEKLFDKKNGITLCRPCHQKTIWKEMSFAEKYSALTNSQ